MWVKPLADGSKAIGLGNRGESPNEITVYFRDAGLGEHAALRDLWERRELGVYRDSYRQLVPTRGIVLARAYSK